MTDDERKELAAAYALGVLDETERRQVDALLARGDAESKQLIEEMQQIAALLPYAADEIRPAPALKSHLMAALREEPAMAPEPDAASRLDARIFDTLEAAIRKWRRLSIGLGLGLAAALVLLFMHVSDLQRTIQSLRSQNTISSELIEQLRIRLSSQERLLRVVRSPQVQIVDLSGQLPAPQARGVVFLNPVEAKALFYSERLPAAGANQDYQLWILEGSRPVSAGVFLPDANGQATLLVEQITNVRRVTAFAVTMEPKGGVPQPTGQMYLLGTVRGG